MAVTADPVSLIREAVTAERARRGSVKAAIAAVARRFGMAPRRIESAWWSQPLRLDWQDAERIRAAAAAQWQRDIAEAEARVGVDLDVPIRNVGCRHFPIWSPDLSALPGGLPR